MNLDKMSSIELADKVLPFFNDYDMTNIYGAFTKAGLSNKEIQELRLIDETIFALKNTLGYIEKTGNSGQWYLLTDLGRHVKKSGGHFAYLKKIEEKALADTERQRLNDEKLKYDVKNAKRIFKTYWWTFAFALVGLFISLGLAILKLLEVFQDKPVK